MMKRWRIPVRARIKGVIFILLFLLGLTAAHSGIIEVSAVGVRGKVGEMAITLEFTEPVNYRSFTLENPPRLVLDIPGVTLKKPRTIEVRNEVVETIKYEQYQPDTVRIVVSLTQPAKSRVRKAGKKLLLYFSLPRETKARLRAGERAKAKTEKEMKKKSAAEEKARIKRERVEARRLALASKAELKNREEEKRRLEAEREVKKREEVSRKRAEERARQLLDKKLKREVELKAKEVLSKKKKALETARREAEERKRKIEDSLSRGEKYCQDNHFDEAIREFETVLALEPGNEKARNYLTLSKGRKEEERRRQEIRRREEEKKKSIVEHLNRGRGYRLQGRYADAISEGEKVLALSPDNSPAEELIIRSKKQALEASKKKVQAEKEIVEERRTLDVSRAIYTSPINYTEAINPEKGMLAGEKTTVAPGERRKEEQVAGLKKKAAETMVTMNFKDTDLSAVILYLSKLSGLTIALDERALDELDNPRVSIYTPTAIPLTDALDLILKVKGLDYVIKESYIWVTKKGLGQEAVTKTYRLKYGIRKIRAVTLTPSGNQEQNQ